MEYLRIRKRSWRQLLKYVDCIKVDGKIMMTRGCKRKE
jgi:hypothetical protein